MIIVALLLLRVKQYFVEDYQFHQSQDSVEVLKDEF